MTTDTLVDDAARPTRRRWTSARWAPWAMVVVLLLLVAAPARIWLHAAVVRAADPAVPPALRLLWVAAGLAPTLLGIATGFVLRRRPARRRLVVAALWAATLGLVTILPITPYVYSF